MLRRAIISAEGSPRPRVGVKPPPGGRSGAARPLGQAAALDGPLVSKPWPFRQVQLVLGASAAALAALLFPSLAGASEAGSVAYTACSEAPSIWALPISDLRAAGWTARSELAGDDLIRITNGRILAMGATRDVAINWREAEVLAMTAADGFVRMARRDLVQVFSHETEAATLVAYRRPNEAFHIVHCVYGGPLGPEMKELTDSMALLDELGGVTQATPEIYIGNIASQSPSERDPAKQHVIDAQFGVLLTDRLPELDRPSKAAFGMSIFSYTQR